MPRVDIGVLGRTRRQLISYYISQYFYNKFHSARNCIVIYYYYSYMYGYIFMVSYHKSIF